MMALAAFLSLLFLLCPGTAAGTGHGSPFTLTIQEKRSEEIVTPGADSTVPADFETNSSVYGRFIVADGQPGILHAFTDSITIAAMQPFPFETFMSRDTIYYKAEGRPNLIGKRIDAITDSMLQCVFDEPSLAISSISGSGAGPAGERGENAMVQPRSISHRKPDCGSGEYSRLDLPVSLGFFFAGIPRADAGKDFIWKERKPLPSYSGLRFSPELVVALRIVEVARETVTLVVNADTTFTDLRLTMPSGEEIDLLSNRIHIGGTIVIDPATGIATTGELRIEEEISYLRPRMSTLPASKRCSYLLRLKAR